MRSLFESKSVRVSALTLAILSSLSPRSFASHESLPAQDRLSNSCAEFQRKIGEASEKAKRSLVHLAFDAYEYYRFPELKNFNFDAFRSARDEYVKYWDDHQMSFAGIRTPQTFEDKAAFVEAVSIVATRVKGFELQPLQLENLFRPGWSFAHRRRQREAVRLIRKIDFTKKVSTTSIEKLYIHLYADSNGEMRSVRLFLKRLPYFLPTYRSYISRRSKRGDGKYPIQREYSLRRRELENSAAIMSEALAQNRADRPATKLEQLVIGKPLYVQTSKFVYYNLGTIKMVQLFHIPLLLYAPPIPYIPFVKVKKPPKRTVKWVRYTLSDHPKVAEVVQYDLDLKERWYKVMIPVHVIRSTVHYGAVLATSLGITLPLITQSDREDLAAGNRVRDRAEHAWIEASSDANGVSIEMPTSRNPADLKAHLAELKRLDQGIQKAITEVERAEHKHYGKKIVISATTSVFALMYFTGDKYLSRPQEEAVKFLTRGTIMLGLIARESPYIPSSQAQQLKTRLQQMHEHLNSEISRLENSNQR